MDYDLLISGNWEVVYGKDQMIQLINDYKMQVITSNMYHETTNEPLFPQYYITKKNGVSIGFISYNYFEIPIRQNPEYSKDMQFTEVKANVKQLIHKLKKEEKVDVLILIAHIGISKQIALVNNLDIEGVDFIFGNDTHERIRKPIEGKFSKVVEPGAFGAFVDL